MENTSTKIAKLEALTEYHQGMLENIIGFLVAKHGDKEFLEYLSSTLENTQGVSKNAQIVAASLLKVDSAHK